MIPFLLSFLGWGKMVAQAVFAWLSKLSLSQLCCIVLLIACLIEFSALRMEQRHSRKVEAQLVKCSEVQKRLVEQSKVKRQQVTHTIDHYITVMKPAVIKERQKIERAPLKGNCQTPDLVMGADV